MKSGAHREKMITLILLGVAAATEDWCVEHEVTVSHVQMTHSEAMAYCNAQGKMLLKTLPEFAKWLLFLYSIIDTKWENFGYSL